MFDSATKFFSILISLLLLASCTRDMVISPQIQQINWTVELKNSKEAEARPNSEFVKSVGQLKQEAYHSALDYLKKVPDRFPKAKPVIQSLINHPDKAFEVFEGCYDYRSENFGSPQRKLSQNWKYESALHHSQNFPKMAQYLWVYEVSPQKHLLVLDCLFGPYWADSVVYLYSEIASIPEVKRLKLTKFDRETAQVVPMIPNTLHGFQRYDQSSQTLSFNHKFSGAGSCGHSGIYRLENDELVLQEFRQKDGCVGTFSSESYPRLYPID